jgi:hypothetical protein
MALRLLQVLQTWGQSMVFPQTSNSSAADRNDDMVRPS